jgi:5-methyltetrahydrofolate--homocysteine methyltransferase
MDLRDILKNRVLIFDGAMGTMLGKYDSELYSFPELLNLQNPDLVESIHRRYVQAGADVITTFTIGVNSKKMKVSPYTVQEIIAAACRTAKRAADGAYVALGIGPLSYGLTSMELSYAEMVDSFKEIIAIGIREGVDALLFESFVDVVEARTAVLTAKSMTDLPVLVTFSLQKNGKTITGDTIEQAVTAVETLGVTAIGLNCTLAPADLLTKLSQIRTLTKLPIILQPNAGPSKLSGGRRVYMNNVDGFASALKNCVESGAAMIGGCCGTTPSYIQSISKFKKIYYKLKPNDIKRYVSNAKGIVALQRPLLIGEGLSTVGSDIFSQWIENRDDLAIVEEGKRLSNLGVDLLDFYIDKPVDSLFLRPLMHQLGYLLKTPLVLGASDLQLLEIMLESYPGRCVISGYGMDKLSAQREALHLAKRYGAYIICPVTIELTSDFKKDNALKLVDNLLYECMKAGVREDCLIVEFMISSIQPRLKPYEVFLEALSEITGKRHLLTFMNLGTATEGSQERDAFQVTLFAMALARGLDLVMVNPMNAFFKVIQNGYKQLIGQESAAALGDRAGGDIQKNYLCEILSNQQGLQRMTLLEGNRTLENIMGNPHKGLKRKKHIVYVFSDEDIGIEAPYVLGQYMPSDFYKVYEQFEVYHVIETGNIKALFEDKAVVVLMRVTIGALKEIHSRLKGLQDHPAFYVSTRKTIDPFFEQLNLEPPYAQMAVLVKDVILPQLQYNK